jgi:hypothetical protein
VDLNHRPLGYEGKTTTTAVQTRERTFKKTVDSASLLSPLFVPFHTVFTDKNGQFARFVLQ